MKRETTRKLLTTRMLPTDITSMRCIMLRKQQSLTSRNTATNSPWMLDGQASGFRPTRVFPAGLIHISFKTWPMNLNLRCSPERQTVGVRRNLHLRAARRYQAGVGQNGFAGRTNRRRPFTRWCLEFAHRINRAQLCGKHRRRSAGN